jgi:hypothetical protein
MPNTNLSALERESLIITTARLNTAREEVDRLARVAKDAALPDLAKDLLALRDILRRPTQLEAIKSLEMSKKQPHVNQDAASRMRSTSS